MAYTFNFEQHILIYPAMCRCGTIFTIAPECIAKDGATALQNTAAIDAWGLGVTLYIMLVGKYPFQVHSLLACNEEYTQRSEYQECRHDSPDQGSNHESLVLVQDMRRPQDDQRTIQNTLHGRLNPIPDHVSSAARHLILSLMQTNPADRITLEEAFEHPFVTQKISSQRVSSFVVGRLPQQCPVSAPFPAFQGKFLCVQLASLESHRMPHPQFVL